MFTTDISAVLNDYDLDALEDKGFAWGEAGAKDLRVLNKYLRAGEQAGAHWGNLQAVALEATQESVTVTWNRAVA